MNKSEKIAYKYLLSKGYKPEQIKFHNGKHADFSVGEKRYEVKYLYHKSLVFSTTQMKYLRDNDRVIVVSKGQVIDDTPLVELKVSNKYNLRVYEEKFTTLLVKPETKDKLKKIKEEKNMNNLEETLSYLINNTTAKDDIKPVLLYRDNQRFYHLLELAKVLHQMKLISNPSIEDVIQLAEDNLIRGMEKSLQNTQSPPLSPLTNSGGL